MPEPDYTARTVLRVGEGTGEIHLSFLDPETANRKEADALVQRMLADMAGQTPPGMVVTAYHHSGSPLTDSWTYVLCLSTEEAVRREESTRGALALFASGPNDGLYDVVGLSYTPARNTEGTPAKAYIALHNGRTRCLLEHNYGTGVTTVRWDSETTALQRDDTVTGYDTRKRIEESAGGRPDRHDIFNLPFRSIFDAFAASQ